jgi:hypothetical protein
VGQGRRGEVDPMVFASLIREKWRSVPETLADSSRIQKTGVTPDRHRWASNLIKFQG